VLAGILATSISLPLIGGLGYSHLATHTLLLAFLTVISAPLTFSLIGLERFGGYFTVAALGSVAKLGLGMMLALLGLGFLAPLIGYIVYPPNSIHNSTSHPNHINRYATHISF